MEFSIGRQRSLRKQHRSAKQDGKDKDEVSVRGVASGERGIIHGSLKEVQEQKKDPSLETTRRVSGILPCTGLELGGNQPAASQAQQAHESDAEHA